MVKSLLSLVRSRPSAGYAGSDRSASMLASNVAHRPTR